MIVGLKNEDFIFFNWIMFNTSWEYNSHLFHHFIISEWMQDFYILGYKLYIFPSAAAYIASRWYSVGVQMVSQTEQCCNKHFLRFLGSYSKAWTSGCGGQGGETHVSLVSEFLTKLTWHDTKNHSLHHSSQEKWSFMFYTFRKMIISNSSLK